MSVYIPADQLHEIREAIRFGRSLEFIAATVGIDLDELQQLVGEPQWKAAIDRQQSLERSTLQWDD